MSIERQQATVYYAPTARRRYFTLMGAATAEAKAQMRRKYPATDDAGPGEYWDWTADPWLLEAFQRLRTRIVRKAKAVQS